VFPHYINKCHAVYLHAYAFSVALKKSSGTSNVKLKFFHENQSHDFDIGWVCFHISGVLFLIHFKPQKLRHSYDGYPILAVRESTLALRVTQVYIILHYDITQCDMSLFRYTDFGLVTLRP